MIESSIIQARSASEWILWLLADSLAGASSLYAGAKVLNGVARWGFGTRINRGPRVIVTS